MVERSISYAPHPDDYPLVCACGANSWLTAKTYIARMRGPHENPLAMRDKIAEDIANGRADTKREAQKRMRGWRKERIGPAPVARPFKYLVVTGELHKCASCGRFYDVVTHRQQ